MSRKVVLDQEECIGCETCVELCPEVFAFDEEAEKARVIKETGGPVSKAAHKAATGKAFLKSRS